MTYTWKGGRRRGGRGEVMSGTCCAVMPLQDTPFIPTTTSPGQAKRERAALVGVKEGLKKNLRNAGYS